MKKILWIVVGLLFLCAPPLWADEASRRQLAKELLTVMDTEKQFNEMMQGVKEQMKKTQMAFLTSAPGYQKNVDLEQKTEGFIEQEMSWERMESDFLSIYAEVFTDEELQGLINFYKTEVGQKYVQKTPEITKKMMAINQKRMLELGPKIQAIAQEVQNPQQPTPSP